jgi:hypothetical protein
VQDLDLLAIVVNLIDDSMAEMHHLPDPGPLEARNKSVICPEQCKTVKKLEQLFRPIDRRIQRIGGNKSNASRTSASAKSENVSR